MINMINKRKSIINPQPTNKMPAVYQHAPIRHRAYIALITAEGTAKQAADMEDKIADEPETIINLQNHLLGLGGKIPFGGATA